jgi:hypothetical protein
MTTHQAYKHDMLDIPSSKDFEKRRRHKTRRGLFSKYEFVLVPCLWPQSAWNFFGRICSRWWLWSAACRLQPLQGPIVDLVVRGQLHCRKIWGDHMMYDQRQLYFAVESCFRNPATKNAQEAGNSLDVVFLLGSGHVRKELILDIAQQKSSLIDVHRTPERSVFCHSERQFQRNNHSGEWSGGRCETLTTDNAIQQ